ncbi:MAG TPA: PadR family transcriptional regulator [Blastocatellia bacterium]|nr:PadR family transcriptional regulator [Blastocatellia bacterium]HMV84809.1 PadR family transcriptional regulator [Blastocatellia bacterium]HMY70676.1 PadR family transcriptional regulator [Blastocatellia bacterium]HMZ19773.1 PadR family transcriptional regulator [Blastocatellia bacterium]HNG31757.1 PadR family transcriptional regulator [Blastocatellia bacterium]
MAKKKADLLQGTLDLLILKTLVLEPMHGWGISQRIQQTSQGVLNVNQGSLYPALYRLEEQGWIKASWDVSDNNRQAKYYELTRAGRKQLEEETKNWERLSTAVAQVLAAS